jgi:hypothetical protein|tara:strand:- start:6417 stop:6530 length:114 start_codon:yes stop_codon:yes gene_type:complete
MKPEKPTFYTTNSIISKSVNYIKINLFYTLGETKWRL